MRDKKTKMDEHTEHIHHSNTNKWNTYLLGAIAVMLFVTMIVAWNTGSKVTEFTDVVLGKKAPSAQQQQPAQQQPAAQQPTESQKLDITLGDSPTKGATSPKVVIVEFSDFQCPFCSRGTSTMKQVIDKYGSEVKLVFKQYPLSFHENAQNAAEASLCANEQGKFWELHDKMFANQGALTMENLKSYAKEVGLDIDKFNTCMDSDKMLPKITADMNQAGQIGTPTFVVGKLSGSKVSGRMFSGACPLATFEEVIKAEKDGKNWAVNDQCAVVYN